MKSFNASRRLSSGALAAALVLMPARAAAFAPQLETHHTPAAQTTIEEWHWRNMTL